MRIAIGSDHAGYDLKEHLKAHLRARGIDVRDFGTDGTVSCDYPDFALEVALAVASRESDRGMLVCSTGVGMSIAANKVRGIRAAVACNLDVAIQSRSHLDSNVIVFGQKLTDKATAARIADAWLETPFEGGRHARRVKKITDYEEKSRR